MTFGSGADGIAHIAGGAASDCHWEMQAARPERTAYLSSCLGEGNTRAEDAPRRRILSEWEVGGRDGNEIPEGGPIDMAKSIRAGMQGRWEYDLSMAWRDGESHEMLGKSHPAPPAAPPRVGRDPGLWGAGRAGPKRGHPEKVIAQVPCIHRIPSEWLGNGLTASDARFHFGASAALRGIPVLVRCKPLPLDGWSADRSGLVAWAEGERASIPGHRGGWGTAPKGIDPTESDPASSPGGALRSLGEHCSVGPSAPDRIQQFLREPNRPTPGRPQNSPSTVIQEGFGRGFSRQEAPMAHPARSDPALLTRSRPSASGNGGQGPAGAPPGAPSPLGGH